MVVDITATLPGSTTAPVSIAFDNILSAGQTTVATSDHGQPPPAGFKLGTPPVYYDVLTTATFSGNVKVCFTWTEGQFHNESNIRLRHLESNVWVDVTASVDTTNNVACGNVTSFSWFALMEDEYSFTGFFQPVDNAPTVNTVKAGQAVPVKFSLGGNRGLTIFDPGYPGSRSAGCTNSIADAVEETVTAGASALQYDSATNQYTYVWKTTSSWAGTCRTLLLYFNDGSQAMANFQFKK